jgi:hypothetical protein
MPRKGKPENLKPVRTTKEAKARGAAGGVKSGESRRKKKLMSQIYGEFLEEKFAVTVDGKKQDMTGEALVNSVVKKVLIGGGAPAVSLMREIREAIEGQKMRLDIPAPDLTPAERKKRIAELESRRRAKV